MQPRIIAILLALFFGGIGAHRFYMNRPKSGIMYFLFCWTLIPGLIALCEVVNMSLFMSDKGFNKKYRNYVA